MKKMLFCIGFVFLAVYILPLGIRPMLLPDETRYAEIPREIIATGDWVTPRLNGLRYFEKPVMGYWLNALSIKAFGENSFAVRFPSALSAGLTALLLFFFVRRFTSDSLQSGLTALIYLTFLEVYCIGVFNVIDGIVSFFTSASMMMFYLAWSERNSTWRYRLFLILSGMFCGLACHTKGFLGVILPVIVITPFLFWEKEGKRLLTLPWIPLITAFFVVFPWGYLIHFKEPAFWDFFIWNEHIRRFMAHDAQHKKSFFYFFIILPLGAFPWTALFPSVLSGLKKKGLNDTFIRFCLCWLAFPFLFFSVSSGKLATYILPCLAPLAVLIAMGLFAYSASESRKSFNRGVVGLAVFFFILIAALIIIQSNMVKGLTLYSDGSKTFLFVSSLLTAILWLFAAFRSRNGYRKIFFLSVSPLLFYFVLHYLIPDQVMAEYSPGKFLEKNRELIDDKTIIVSTNPQISAVCWAFKRQDVYLLMGGGELDYGLSCDDSKHRKLSLDQFREIVSQSNEKNRIVLVIDTKRYKKWVNALPLPYEIKENEGKGYILACY